MFRSFFLSSDRKTSPGWRRGCDWLASRNDGACHRYSASQCFPPLSWAGTTSCCFLNSPFLNLPAPLSQSQESQKEISVGTPVLQRSFDRLFNGGHCTPKEALEI